MLCEGPCVETGIFDDSDERRKAVGSEKLRRAARLADRMLDGEVDAVSSSEYDSARAQSAVIGSARKVCSSARPATPLVLHQVVVD